MKCKKINYKPIFVSQEENGIISDIRKLEFGNICVHIQNGFIVDKAITKNIRNIYRKNNLNSDY